MIDRVKIYVKAGDGGNGIISFRREKYVPLGGPDGGDGGDGGNIYLEGDSGVSTLQGFRHRKQFGAKNGVHGKGQDMHGKNGKDLILKVPLGTLVRRKDDGESLITLDDIVSHGQRSLVAQGGKGGLGNARFVSSTNRAPRIAQEGQSGEEAWLILDLKLIADVGIAGYPNVGKSTLLSAVSKAKPKIADYPFTTLEPVIGVVELGYQSFVLADIPGLIEGAHQGVGLGIDFLRHIERTKVIIQLVDGSSTEPTLEMEKVNHELKSYGSGLLNKKRIVAINKIDLPEVQAHMSQLKSEIEDIIDDRVYFISAATGEGTEDLMKKALELISQEQDEKIQEHQEDQYRIFRPTPIASKKKRES